MSRRVFRLPEPVDVWRDQVAEFVGQLGHDPNNVLRVRIHPRVIEVDLRPPRRDVTKLTVMHAILDPDGEVDE